MHNTPRIPKSTLKELYDERLQYWIDEWKLSFAAILSLNPITRQTVCVARKLCTNNGAGEIYDDIGPGVLAQGESPADLAISSRKVRWWEIDGGSQHDSEVSKVSTASSFRFPNRATIERTGTSRVAVIPVLNSSNSNQILYVLLLGITDNSVDLSRPYREREVAGEQRSMDAASRERTWRRPWGLTTARTRQAGRVSDQHESSEEAVDREQSSSDQHSYETLARHFAVDAENTLLQICVRGFLRLQTDVSRIKYRSPEVMCTTLAGITARIVTCMDAYVFLKTDEDLSALGASLHGEDPIVTATESMSVAENAFARNREQVGYGSHSSPHTLAVPLRDASGYATGCIVMAKLASDRPFTYEDIAVVEWIGMAFVAQSEIVVAEQRKIEGLIKLGHELRVPIVAFRAALERVARTCEEQDYKFRYDFLGDLEIYSDLMQSQLTELEFYKLGPERIPLTIRDTHFEQDLMAPARRFVKPLALKRGFDPEKIRYSLDAIPRLKLDRALFTQVVFNLLENAIKYSSEDFAVQVNGHKDGGYYYVTFRNRSEPIPHAYRERIFDPWVRTPKAKQSRDIVGDGYGLFLARCVVRRHGGELSYRQLGAWAEFILKLPTNLEKSPPGAFLPVE